MRKVTLTVIGIVGLSLLLCSSSEVLAQTEVAGGAEASPEELRQSMLRLQADVAQLRRELAQVRAELANVAASIGAGGAGQAGVDPAAPPGIGVGPGVPPGAGEAVVQAFYGGRVQAVTGTQLVLEDDIGQPFGQPFAVELGAQTRIIRNGQLISAQQLEQGMRVQVTANLLEGRTHATEVIVLP